MKECRVCLGLHDPQIHEATLSVHAWFKGQLLMDRTIIPGKKPNPGANEARRMRGGIPIGIPMTGPSERRPDWVTK